MWFIFFISIKIIDKKNKREEKGERFKYFEKCNVKKYCDKKKC